MRESGRLELPTGEIIPSMKARVASSANGSPVLRWSSSTKNFVLQSFLLDKVKDAQVIAQLNAQHAKKVWSSSIKLAIQFDLQYGPLMRT